MFVTAVLGSAAQEREEVLREGNRGKEGSPSKRHSGTQVGLCENEDSHHAQS